MSGLTSRKAPAPERDAIGSDARAGEKRERDLRDRKRIEDGLRLLSRTGAAVVESLDYKQTLKNIASAFVDGFAAYCLIDVIPAGGVWERTAVHRDPALVPLFTRITRPSGNHPIARAINAGESCVTAIDDAWLRNLDSPTNADRREAIHELRVRSIICVPIRTPAGKTVGALTCALDQTNERENYDRQDLEFVEEVARRAGAAIANVQLFERERRIADELQAASLPTTLPVVDGIVLDAAYRPGSDEAKIGGDWYDAFLLADGSLIITVGDVIGHGLGAAISMTKLRLAMQSAAIASPDPNLMLRVADAVIRMSGTETFATAIAAVYEPTSRTLTFASAGHPNPILRNADGTLVEFRNWGPMIGLRTGDENDTTTVVIPNDSALVFYTDGLIEVVRDLDEGSRRLSEAVRSDEVMRASRPANAIVRAVLAADNALDDIAVLVATFLR
jgi:serine phosphatase RsbU (regulator of sigma subunit)